MGALLTGAVVARKMPDRRRLPDVWIPGIDKYGFLFSFPAMGDCSVGASFLREARLPGIDFKAVRDRISMAAVLELLRFAPCESGGSQLRGPCPIHGSGSPTSRSFSVNVGKNAFRCFRCGASGNQIDLWAAVTKTELHAAAMDLCEKLDLDVPWIRVG